MIREFRIKLKNNPIVKQIRGRGLMIGIELEKECGELVQKALCRNLLINVASGNVIRLLPPLIISENQGRKIVDEVVSLIELFYGNA